MNYLGTGLLYILFFTFYADILLISIFSCDFLIFISAFYFSFIFRVRIPYIISFFFHFFQHLIANIRLCTFAFIRLMNNQGGNNLPQGGSQGYHNPQGISGGAPGFTSQFGFGAPPPTVYYVPAPPPAPAAPPVPAAPQAAPAAQPAPALPSAGSRRVAVYDLQLRGEVERIRDILQQLLHELREQRGGNYRNHRSIIRRDRGRGPNRRRSPRRDPPPGENNNGNGQGDGGVAA